MRPILALILFAVAGPSLAQELANQQKNSINRMEALLRTAGGQYAAGEYDQAGQTINQTITLLHEVLEDASPEQLEAFQTTISRIIRAHTKIEFAGVNLLPLELTTLLAAKRSESKIRPEAPAPAMGVTSGTKPMTPAGSDAAVDFAKDVAPLFAVHCQGCHLESTRIRGGLRMDTVGQLLRGGDSGTVIEAGDSESSILVQRLRGIDGQRMPAGGRPALPPESIKLIAKWIDTGAKLEGINQSQPLPLMAQLAWTKSATTEQIDQRRRELAEQNLRKVVASSSRLGSGSLASSTSESFLVIGPAAQSSVDLIADQAESLVPGVNRMIPAGDRPPFGGRATIIVVPRRYDYSEWTRMVEQRSVPTDWNSHWKYDGIDAYIVLIATDQDSPEIIRNRLAGPLVSLATATVSSGIPIWLADGVGKATTWKQRYRGNREAARQVQADLSTAITAMSSARQFLDGGLNPTQTDLIATALAASMIDGKRRRAFDALLRAVADGKEFPQAFSQAYDIDLEQYIEAWRSSYRR